MCTTCRYFIFISKSIKLFMSLFLNWRNLKEIIQFKGYTLQLIQGHKIIALEVDVRILIEDTFI